MFQHKPTFRSKNPRIIASELNLEWEHLFQAFLTWFRRKNDLGGVEKSTKEKTEQTAYIEIMPNDSVFGMEAKTKFASG